LAKYKPVDRSHYQAIGLKPTFIKYLIYTLYCDMDITEYSCVVAGSGFPGTVTAERIANQLNQPALVIGKRDPIGGNRYAATGPTATDSATGIVPLIPTIHAV
jgi:hypothetical protein